MVPSSGSAIAAAIYQNRMLTYMREGSPLETPGESLDDLCFHRGPQESRRTMHSQIRSAEEPWSHFEGLTESSLLRRLLLAILSDNFSALMPSKF